MPSKAKQKHVAKVKAKKKAKNAHGKPRRVNQFDKAFMPFLAAAMLEDSAFPSFFYKGLPTGYQK